MKINTFEGFTRIPRADSEKLSMAEVQKAGEIHENLVDNLHYKIRKSGKNINGFDVFYDSFSGTIEWSNKYYSIMATPYWDGNYYIPIDIFDNNGNEFNFDNYSIPLTPLKNMKELKSVLNIYYDEIYKITKKLNKRQELIEVLPKIKEYIEYIKININGKVYNQIFQADENSVNNIQYIKIKTDTIIEIYNTIKTNNPEIFNALKFNL